MLLYKKLRGHCLLFILIIFSGHFSWGQSAVVLPTDGTNSFEISPQGNLRYQRQFYLITKDEVQQSNLPLNAYINSLGFTLGHKQSAPTKGDFQIYLQNTQDKVARIDSIWQSVVVNSNEVFINGLNQGDFEWEVYSICSDTSNGSDISSFSTQGNSCNAPSNLFTNNIGETTATLHWDQPFYNGNDSFIVEYTELSPVNWISATISDTVFNINGLTAGTIYQWRVRTSCPGETTFNVGSFFSTLPQDLCTELNGLNVDSVSSNFVKLSWNPESSSIRYNIQYRPKGTSSWLDALATTNSIVIKDEILMSTGDTIVDVIPGTVYEWRVRNVCGFNMTTFADSVGSYTSGPDFQTLGTLKCAPPVSLKSSKITNSSARLSWLPNPNASQYLVRYRLKKSIEWQNAIAPMHLVHDHQVKIPASIGPWDIPFTGDTLFRDSFNIVISVKVNTLNSFVTNLQVDSFYIDSDTLYTFKYNSGTYTPSGFYSLLVNPVVSTISTSPDSVKIDLFSSLNNTQIPVKTYFADSASISGDTLFTYTGPDDTSLTLNQTIFLKLQLGITNNPVIDSLIEVDSFTYSGDGLYVAFEYTNKNGPLSTFNRSLATERNPSSIKSVSGLDSVQALICLKTQFDESASAHKERLTAIQKRPETRLGSPAFNDIAEVVNIYALGHNAIPYGNPSPVTGVIKNNSNSAQTFTINLQVFGRENKNLKFSQVVPLNISANTVISLPTSAWLPVTKELDSIVISISPVAGENVIQNNFKSYIQDVNEHQLAYDDNSENISSAGLDTTSGLILTRYIINGCATVNGVDVFLDPSAAKNEVYGVVLDGNGNIIETTLPFTPDSTVTNDYYSFYFEGTPSFSDEIIYIGLAQTIDSVNGYKPVGVQWETALIRSGAYYRSNLDGTNLTEVKTPGRLMIKAELVPDGEIAEINGNLNICDSSGTMLFVGSKTQRYANKVLNVSSEFSKFNYGSLKALGAPDVFPKHDEDNPNQWISKNPDEKREFIDLQFPDPNPVNYIEIYQTLNPGAVDSVYIFDTTGALVLVFTKLLPPDTVTNEDKKAKILKISFPKTTYDVSSIRISLASDSIDGSNGIDAVAIGERKDTGSFTSYSWSPGGETTSEIVVLNPDTVSVTVTKSNGCASTASAAVKAPVQIDPMIIFDPVYNTQFCMGDSIVLMSDQNGGNIWNTSDSSNSITVKSSGNYFFFYDDGTGCGLVSSDTVSIKVDTLPVPAISGLFSICPGGSANLHAPSGYVSYNWSTGSNSQSISVSVAGNYSLTVIDDFGCVGSASVSAFNGPPPSPAISGPANICPGTNNLLLADSGYIQYNWSTGSMNQSITVTSGDVYSVTVTDVNNCVGSSSITIGEFNPPSPTIGGSLGFCPGSSTTIGVNQTYVSYVWSTGDSSQNVLINLPGVYSVTVTDLNGCQGIASANIMQFDPPQPVIAGTLSFCGGNITTLDAGSGYNSYLWSSGETSQSITVDTADVYSVTVTDNKGCVGDTSVDVTETGQLPATPGPISGLQYGICSIDSVHYSIAPVPNTNFYVWTVPAGATIVSGQGSTEIIVNYASIDSGDIVVAGSNDCGQSPSADPRILKVYGSPALPAPISGQNKGLCSNFGISYSIPPVPNTSSYQWSVPNNVTIISGQGTNMITANFVQLNGQKDFICVTPINNCGNGITQCLEVLMLKKDTIPPVASCMNISISLNAQQMATITPSQVNNGSSDNCTITNMSVNKSSFACMDIGDNAVTLTVTDNFNNSSSCVATVNIRDDLYVCPCFTPTGLVADNITLNNAKLNWTPTPNAISYKLYGERLGFPQAQFTIGGGSTAFLNATKLNHQTGYYWAMRAVCDAGGGNTVLSPISVVDTFMTIGCRNPKNTNTAQLINNPDKATLKWDPVNFAVGYKIFGQAVGGPLVTLEITGNGNVNYPVTGLQPSTTYQWLVVSGCISNGNVIFSNSNTAPVNSFTTLAFGNTQKTSVFDEESELMLYPNPASDKVVLSLAKGDRSKIWSLRIIDINGRVVFERNNINNDLLSNYPIDVSQFSNGLYEVILQGSDEINHLKLVIQR